MTAPFLETRRSLLRGGAVTLVLRVGSLLLAALSSIIFARAMGAEGFGTYAVILAVLSLIGLPTQMGIPTIVLRETSVHGTREDWGRVRAVWWWATRRILLTTPLALGLGLGLAYWLGPQGTFGLLLIGAPLVPLLALGLVRGSAMRALNFVALAQIPTTIVKPGLTVVFVAIAWLALDMTISPELALWFTTAATALSFLLGVWLLYRFQPAALRAAPTTAPDPGWNRSIWPLAGLGAIQVIGPQLALLILGHFGTMAEVGYFKIAQSAASLAVVGLGVVSLVIGPQIARLHSRGEVDRLQSLVARGAAISLAAVILPAAILILAGEPLIRLLYGPDFAAAYPVLMILMIGQGANAFFGAVTALLVMIGNETATLVGIGIGTAVNLGCALLLVPTHGAIGAAIASTAAMIVWNVILWAIARRLTGIDTTVFGLLRSSARRSCGRLSNFLLCN